MATFKDHFSTNTAGYAAHRPTYPAALVDMLADAAPGQQLAFDAGCGTGQLSVLLAERFERVVATDASAAQIANAEPHPRVDYHVAPAEHSGLEDGTADLVTVAQAAHWLDLDAFYREARRIARPGAVIALISYGVLHVEGDAVDAVVQHFYHDIVGGDWPPERRHVEDGYRSLPFPFAPIPRPALAIELAWSLEDLVGYADTWSAVRVAEMRLSRSPIDDFREALATAWGNADRRHVYWPLSVRIGRID